MEHEKCYVYKPGGERPAKRRRIEPGIEHSRRLREQTFKELWEIQEKRVKNVLDAADEKTQSVVTKFIAASHTHEDNQSRLKLPTGLVVAGPSIASHGSFFDQLSEKVALEGENIFALLQSSECPNLKTLLSALIKKTTQSGSNFDDDDEDDTFSRPRKGPRLLSYDLQILFEWMQEHGIERAVIAFQDSEAFEGHLIAEVVDVLR